MNAIELLNILNNDVTVEINTNTLIRLDYAGGILYLTFWHDDILMQKTLTCESPQKVLEWTVAVGYHSFVYALKGVASDFSKVIWFDLHFDPAINNLIISGYNGTNTKLEVERLDNKLFRHIPSLDFLNEKEPDSQTVIHYREWRKLYSAAHIAKTTDTELFIESVGDDIYCHAISPTMRGVYVLTAQGKNSSFDTFKLPFELLEYLQSCREHPNYVEISTYFDDVMVMVEAGNTRFFLPYELRLQLYGFLEIHEESVELAIQKSKLEDALKSAIGNADTEEMDCNEVYLSLDGEKTLTIEGKSQINEIWLKKPVKTDKQPKMLLNAATLLDLLATLEEDNLHLYLPSARFEPLVIETSGLMIYCSGLYKPSRQIQQRYETADTQVVYRRKQSDETEFIVTAIERSILAPYLTKGILRMEEEELENMKDSGYSEGYANYCFLLNQLQNMYGHSMYVYKQARRVLKGKSDTPIKTSVRQELSDRIKELIDAMAESTWYANSDNLEARMNPCEFDREELTSETEKILAMRNDCCLKAGRVLEVLRELPKTYELGMTVML